MAKLTAKGSSSTLMVIIMRETGATIRQRGTGFTSMITVTSMKESGRMMFSTDMVKRDGLMDLLTKAATIKELSTGLGFINGTMVLNTTATGTIT